jgi:hypothetical protein
LRRKNEQIGVDKMMMIKVKKMTKAELRFNGIISEIEDWDIKYKKNFADIFVPALVNHGQYPFFSDTKKVFK